MASIVETERPMWITLVNRTNGGLHRGALQPYSRVEWHHLRISREKEESKRGGRSKEMIVSANRVVAAPRHPLAKLLPTLSVERLWECALGSMDCCELVGWVTFTSGRSRRPEGIPVATERKAIRKPVRYDARPSRGWGACGGLAMTWRACKANRALSAA